MYLAKLWKSDKKREYVLVERTAGRCDLRNIYDGIIMYDISLSTFDDIIPWGLPIVGV